MAELPLEYQYVFVWGKDYDVAVSCISLRERYQAGHLPLSFASCLEHQAWVNDATSASNPIFFLWDASPKMVDIVNFEPAPGKTNPVTGEKGKDFPPWARTLVRSRDLGVPWNPNTVNGPSLPVHWITGACPEGFRKNLAAARDEEAACAEQASSESDEMC